MMRRFASVLVIFAMMAAAGSAGAQQPAWTGFYVGGSAGYAFGSGLSGDDFDGETLDVDAGFNLSAQAGYQFHPMLGVFGAFEHGMLSSEDEDVRQRHIFGGVRLALPTAGASIPYATLGFGRRSLYADDPEGDFEIRGNYVDVGAGLMLGLAPRVALDIGGNVGFGKYRTAQLGSLSVSNLDLDNTTTARIRAGVTFWPMR